MFKSKKLQAELEKTESAFADVSNHAMELQDELATLKLEHEKLTQLYQGFSCQHQEVLEAHNALKRELQEAKKQIGKYQKLVEDQKEHCRLHVETHEEDLRKIAQLQVTIGTQLETIQQQNATIDDLRKANDDLHEVNEKMRESNDELIDAIEKLADEKSTLIQRIENQARTIGQLQKQTGTTLDAGDVEEGTA